MSGSGNDFLFFDTRVEPAGELTDPAVIDRLCARGTGVGADGIVLLQADATEQLRIRYFNRDGSLGELCGNASLCTTRLASELHIGDPAGFRFATDAGVIRARLTNGEPQIDLQSATGLRPEAGIALESGESRIGFVDTGVPHLVVLTKDTASVEVQQRGAMLRHHPTLTAGANVNFLSPLEPGLWSMRTFERGVEAETLACGTGAVAAGIMLEAWQLSGPETRLKTRSGRTLTVTVRHEGSAINPSLGGEGRIVFEGRLSEV